jgi:sugar lactone lactonase YvrE
MTTGITSDMSLSKSSPPGVSVLARDLGELLESPRWHPMRQCISLVDIPSGRLFEIPQGTQRVTEYATGLASLGAALPIGHEGYLLVGETAIWKWSPDAPIDDMTLWATLPSEQGIVSNDALFHEGEVWVGRMDAAVAPGAGSLWRISPERATPVMTGLTLPNGLVPTEDGGALLFAESSAQCIYQVPWDAEYQRASRPDPFLETPDWTPDGLARDAFGHLWVARWGEGKVTRPATPSTPQLDVVVPTPQTTALAFDANGAMYVTTGRESFTAEERAIDPLAGSVFRIDVPGWGG